MSIHDQYEIYTSGRPRSATTQAGRVGTHSRWFGWGKRRRRGRAGDAKGDIGRILRPRGGARRRPPRTGPVFCCLLLWRRAAERAPARRAAGFAGRVNSWSLNPDSVFRLRLRWPGWGRGPTVRTSGAQSGCFFRPQCWPLRVLGVSVSFSKRRPKTAAGASATFPGLRPYFSGLRKNMAEGSGAPEARRKIRPSGAE